MDLTCVEPRHHTSSVTKKGSDAWKEAQLEVNTSYCTVKLTGSPCAAPPNAVADTVIG